MPLPPYAPHSLVAERLPLIFPEGTPNRGYCTRDAAASTVFVALYIGAVEGAEQSLQPAHVYRMTEEQSEQSDDGDRLDYFQAIRAKRKVRGERWYTDNSREQIRDESLRDGLVYVGAIIRREDVATTSSLPRYVLKSDFARLFDPELQGNKLEAAIAAFRDTHLSKGALARVAIMRAGATASEAGLLVTFPSGETRQLAPGPSSFITKAVVEVFASRFLQKPAILWLSESGNKVVLRDDAIASAIGLRIEADKNLPDLILADLGPKDPLLVFVEVVATDGAITPRRQEAIFAMTDAAGFHREHVKFLTAYTDRDSPGFKKTVAQLAWGSFAWFASEPENLAVMLAGAPEPTSLAAIMDR